MASNVAMTTGTRPDPAGPVDGRRGCRRGPRRVRRHRPHGPRRHAHRRPRRGAACRGVPARAVDGGGPDGVPAGLEIDLVEGFAQTLDADVVWSTGGEEELVDDLERGELDLVVGGFSASSPWTSKAAVTVAYATVTDADGKPEGHVMLTPMGENAFLVELERFLLDQEVERTVTQGAVEQSFRFGNTELPPDAREAARRAKRLAWLTIAFLVTAVTSVYLVMGSSQAMKAAWAEDLLSFIPPIAFLVALRVTGRVPSEQHPYGYHRSVGIGHLVAATALLTMGAFLVVRLGVGAARR